MQDLDLAAYTDQAVQLATDWGLRIAGAILLFVVGRMVAGWLRRTSRRAFGERLDPSLVAFFSSLIYYGVMVFVLLAVLARFGIQTASFVAVLGAASLAIGLAMQGTFSNFAAGVMILVFRPFKSGDLVDIAGTRGLVADIGLFSTTLNTLDNKQVIVPNGSVWGETITNYNANETRRVDMTFGVGYDDDLAVASKTIRSTVEAHSLVLAEPAPIVEVAELGDSSVNFAVRPWCKTEDYWRVYFDLHRSLKEELEKSGCSIPFPQRDVHLHQVAG
ncbi:MAG: mechanosensitive ion channel [Gemmatimonadetes bacterium]|nr:mechanosensitive ion channel [Gemmatimonadota bacterium]